MIAHYEDTRSNIFFSQLINLKQKGSVIEHIENFQRLNIKVTNIPNEHLIDVFIGTLKDNIQHEVLLWEPKSLDNAFKVERNVESKNMAMATRRTNPNIYRESVIMVIVDRLTKYAHFCALSHPFKSSTVSTHSWRQFKSYIAAQRLL
jgi:3-deoxy-D-manno-octulosonic-acid transferase